MSVLGHQSDTPVHRFAAQVSHVDAVETDGALVDVVQAGGQTRDRRLARAGTAHQRDHRARRDVDVDVVQHLSPTPTVQLRNLFQRGE